VKTVVIHGILPDNYWFIAFKTGRGKVSL